MCRESQLKAPLTKQVSTVPAVTKGGSYVHNSSIVEDSLMLDDLPITPKRELQSKQDSSVFPESPSFIAKRCNLSTTLLDDTHDASLLVNQTTLNLSGQRSSSPVKEVSFRSSSGLEASNSMLNDVATNVNFEAISISGINESTVSETRLSAEREEGNPEDLSYEALLRWEQQQGGVLDERWERIRDSVLHVLLL